MLCFVPSLTFAGSSRGRGNMYWHPPSRGVFAPRGRGRARGALPLTHHHRTLVLNNKPASIASENGPELLTPAASAASASDSGKPPIATGWVAKRDRHMQLINSSVYDQQAQARAKAMARSQEERSRRREDREKLKFNRFLQNSKGHRNQELVVSGERYLVVGNGSKLVRVSPGEDDTWPYFSVRSTIDRLQLTLYYVFRQF
jgi:hypothetical protein